MSRYMLGNILARLYMLKEDKIVSGLSIYYKSEYISVYNSVTATR